MRRVIITEENRNSFTTTDDVDILKTIDSLLHDRDLELTIGDDGGSSDYMIRIDKCRVDEEYDVDRTYTILYGRGKGLFDQFEI